MVRDLTSFLYNYNATYDRAKDWIYENPPKHFPFFFEVADLVWWQNVMVDYWQFPFVVCVVYLTTVFGMEGWMRGRTPFKLKRFLVCWNVTMALLNLFGFVRQMQELVPILAKPDGFHRSLCIREELNLPTAFWGLFFCLSKYLFLGDTILIVLTKKPLLFIYWYHHAIAIIVPWMIFPDSEPICRHIGGSNFFVLFCMYSYFALKGMHIKLPRRAGLVIAILHVLEMMLGAVVQVYTAREIIKGRDCARTMNSVKWSLIPHVSLLFFFGHLLLKSIHKSKPKTL
ncbi:elongation of very long chain fatty acids protein 6 [Folsomia candida]|uniref:Elongation of very long chain fatty acids protein n=1 Tax=Folsomia candida TaxID=158441 RepID=A0A226DEK9_FOLCA|nr:elongation of very long chain fatty acids protein 6 [Folsomia candida]XP_021962881.1 elongation of very long chain fatty acids protein 6 [Folsomia candida]OXA43623.1 putative fatty acid elongation protein 3 [Folsomia candida]